MAVLTSALLRLYAVTPLPLAHLLGLLLGVLFYIVPNHHRQISAINLALCFPELSKMLHQWYLLLTLIETGKTLFETPILLLASKTRLRRMVRSVHQQQLADRAIAQQGVVMATFHLGAWEMAGAWCSLHYPMVTLYRPPRQQQLEQLIRDSRARFGARLVTLDSRGIRTSLQALKQGEMIGILPDQDPRQHGNLFAPLFGIDANTMTLYGRLVQKGGAAALFCTAERLSFGRGFRLHFSQPADISATESLAQITAALNRELERQIRTQPTQYQWSYKRFRTRPPDHPPLYP
ncbi:lipid A biosynthesis acyltransferase [Ectothiorhodospiraceae bacterium BW-2]|nr:lipid A biosynthesis acyltransferase [Ectothiorhodospiraceae bacterium BW-2]